MTTYVQVLLHWSPVKVKIEAWDMRTWILPLMKLYNADIICGKSIEWRNSCHVSLLCHKMFFCHKMFLCHNMLLCHKSSSILAEEVLRSKEDPIVKEQFVEEVMHQGPIHYETKNRSYCYEYYLPPGATDTAPNTSALDLICKFLQMRFGIW